MAILVYYKREALKKWAEKAQPFSTIKVLVPVILSFGSIAYTGFQKGPQYNDDGYTKPVLIKGMAV